MAMYEKDSPNLKYVSFAEEALPFTDAVPSATIGWGFQFLIPIILGNRNLDELVHSFSLVEQTRTKEAMRNYITSFD